MLYGTVRKELERFFGDDANEIAHALEVTSHALRIQAVDGGDRGIVTPGKITTKEFACLWDADFIVNLREVAPKMESEKLRSLIEGKFLTNEGKRIARGLYLPTVS